MLNKKNGYIILIVLVAGLLLTLQYNQPKKISWIPSYTYQHKTPLGCYIINEIITKHNKSDIEQVTKTPFQFLTAHKEVTGTYFFVNDEVHFDEVELDKLLDWTAQGNRLFIASTTFDDQLLDTLQLHQNKLYTGFDSAIEPNFYHQLVHPSFSNQLYSYDKASSVAYFGAIDTLNTRVISVVDKTAAKTLGKEDRHVNGVIKSFGKGEIVLSLVPQAFTNHFILKGDNSAYTTGLLSYINPYDDTLYMDANYKSGKRLYGSPMHVLLNNKELKWAYYLFIIGAVLYIVFEGKRKQRVIPINVSLKNQTIAYTKLIADMYYERQDTNQVIEHKINSFLEYIRSQFYLSTSEFDALFISNLAAKSQHTNAEIDGLFSMIKKLQNQDNTTKEQLIALNQQIEKFKTKANGK